jgi:hypothetical protein
MEKMAVTVTWKRWLSSVGPHYEYLDAESYNALLHSIDPSLVLVGELLSQRRVK